MKKIILSFIVASSFLFGADFTNSIGMKFVEIPAGSFIIGTPTPNAINCLKENPFISQREYFSCVQRRTGGDMLMNETPAHKVDIAKSFYMQETEVTQSHWYEVMGNNPAEHQNGNPDMPIENVSWEDAQVFIKKLNEKEGTNKYRLPSEEEWEYAARAGITTKWYCGDSKSCLEAEDTIDWLSNPKPVKSRNPNAWGLYDMGGSVWELTDSCSSDNYNSEKKCHRMVIRGGSHDNAGEIRFARRPGEEKTNQAKYIGFRLISTK